MTALQVREKEVQLDYQFKILLLGDSGVGKTSIMNRFTENKFSVDIKSTIGVEYSKKSILIDSTMIQASIWDTAGQERFRALAKTYYKGALGALLVFDLTKPHTLDNISKVWLQEVKQNASEKIKMILIGNKADMVDQRMVRQEDALQLAKKCGFAYIETSALNSQNIDDAFQVLIRGQFILSFGSFGLINYGGKQFLWGLIDEGNNIYCLIKGCGVFKRFVSFSMYYIQNSPFGIFNDLFGQNIKQKYIMK